MRQVEEEPRALQLDQSESLDGGLRRDTMTINMGPQHPSTHGVLRLVLTLDGETILKARPEIGYLHTGIEKTAESKSYFKALVLTDRMDYLAPLCNNLGYSLAVEKLLGVEVPPKAQYARVVLAELQRIASHLVWLGSSALDLGAQSVFLYCFRERELILDIFELCSGVRMMTSYIMPGGLQADLPPTFDEKVRAFLDIFPKRLREYHDLLTNNQLWIDRTKGVGVLTAEQAIMFGCTGATLRGSGIAYDVRKAYPYSGYERFEFDVPVGTQRRCLRPLPRAHAGDGSEHPHHPAGAGRHAGGALAGGRPQGRAAAQVRDLVQHGVADPPLQALHGGVSRPGGRGLPAHGVAEGRAWLLHRQRRRREALSHARARAVLRQPAGAAADDRGAVARGCGGGDRQH